MKPLEPSPKPGVYAYLASWADGTAVDEKRRALVAFAEREGYELVHIYQEDEEGGPALEAAIEITKSTDAPALIVHALSDLGSTVPARRAMKQRLKTHVGVPVILMDARA